MDRKLLFYLLGSVEDSSAKFDVKDEHLDKLGDNIKESLKSVKKELATLRYHVAVAYAYTDVHEGPFDPSESSME